MNIATLIGLVLGIGALLIAEMMDGGSPASLANISAFIIVFGGTFGAALVSFPMKAMANLPSLIGKAMKEPKSDPAALVSLFVTLAEKARREGLLSLEEDVQAIDDAFVKKGLLLVVDGTDPELVRTIMEAEVESLEKRHEDGYGILEAMGGYAPTMGIIGTVMGLVRVLANMSSPDELARSISVAFIATLYGVSSANLLWLPLATKLKGQSGAETFMRWLVIEGILSVQAGDNPRLVKEKLESFIPPKLRNAKMGEKAAEGQAAFDTNTVAANQTT